MDVAGFKERYGIEVMNQAYGTSEGATIFEAADITYGATDVATGVDAMTTTDVDQINVFAGGGFWQPEAQDLKRIRDDFAMDDQPIRQIIADPTFQKYFA